MAMKGSEWMLIWLGKQRLGQVEKIESKTDTANSITIYLPDNGRENDPNE
jgi:hypothetical protein